MIFAPLIPSDLSNKISEKHLYLAKQICEVSLKLSSSHNKFILDEVISLLRTTNSYYSNMIESQGTHPIDIYNASKGNFTNDKKNKSLQELSLIHIEVQNFISNTYQDNKKAYELEYILELHKQFYTKDEMKEYLSISYNNISATMIPGILRDKEVKIGNLIAPTYMHIQPYMYEFESAYNNAIKYKSKEEQLICILASHHRFVYLHPFLDGNGRISRLFLDYLFFKIGIDGYGLWNISRGLARNINKYKEMLSMADIIVQGNTDGRGPLSNRGLEYFLDFMLETSFDQVTYMYENLKMDKLSTKIENFVKLSYSGLIDGIKLPKYTDLLFKNLLLKGELKRSEVAKIIGKSDRTASRLIATLLKEDFLQSKSNKSPISIKINPKFASYIISDLMPIV